MVHSSGLWVRERIYGSKKPFLTWCPFIAKKKISKHKKGGKKKLNRKETEKSSNTMITNEEYYFSKVFSFPLLKGYSMKLPIKGTFSPAQLHQSWVGPRPRQPVTACNSPVSH